MQNNMGYVALKQIAPLGTGWWRYSKPQLEHQGEKGTGRNSKPRTFRLKAVFPTSLPPSILIRYSQDKKCKIHKDHIFIGTRDQNFIKYFKGAPCVAFQGASTRSRGPTRPNIVFHTPSLPAGFSEL